ncbi:hypothetical protein V1478_008998 [Vespula squamosa]|uniref:Uncharacterized protein n=1 Tax=Vespula squamosa TaxID=30214 RepID=A0ABD2AVI1_VESSQ
MPFLPEYPILSDLCIDWIASCKTA